MSSGQLPYQFEVIYIFEILKIFFVYPLGLTQIAHSNLFVEMILILKSDLGKSRISPNFEESVQIEWPMKILKEYKAIEVRNEIIFTR